MSETVCVTLDAQVSIAKVGALQEILASSLDQATKTKTDITINASEVNRIDTASLQLLYAFLREIESRDLQLTWESVSENLFEAAKMLGMGEQLQLSTGSVA